MKKLIQSSVLLFCYCQIVCAQVSLNLVLRTPTPSDLSEWQKDPSIAQLVVTNVSQANFPNSYFTVRIINEKGVEVVNTPKNNRLIPSVNIPSGPGTTLLNGPQILNVNALVYDRSIGTIALTTNSIPEGNYQICISVFDENNKNITTGEEYCTSFFILSPDPPILISPVDDEIVTNAYPNFFWTPVTNITPGVLVKYKLKICPVFAGQTPRTAIESNPVLLEKNDIFNSSYQYLPSDLPIDYFASALRYVWIVQAFDQNGKPATRNQGKSEIATFQIPETRTPAMTITNIYPANNDTIPWDTPHLITRFSPYTDNIRNINITVRVKKEGSSIVLSNTRSISFPGGPQTSQGLSSQEAASLLIVNLDNNRNFPEWMNYLEHGTKYNWNAEVTFTFDDGTTLNASSGENSFIKGFRKPAITSPKNDTSVKAGVKINVSFQVPRPSTLNFVNNDALTNTAFHGYNAFATATGKFSAEFSKTESFDSVFRSQTIQIPTEEAYSSGNNCDDLFNVINKQIEGISDTGLYYWRINYLGASDVKYYSSPIRTLRITPATSAGCFEMQVESPPNNGTWTTNKNPRFAVSVNPQINKPAITDGRIKVWKMISVSENFTEVKSRKTVLDTTFTGNDNSKIYAYSTDMMGYTRYDLNFINGDSSSVTFTADSAASYLWNFQLKYQKDSIRTDKKLCDTSFVNSNDGIFTVSPAPADSGSCPGDCFSAEPTNRTPSTQTFAADSVIKIGQFKLKLKTVSGTGSSLSGEGSIDVPYFRGDILVEFNGIKVNTNNEVYEGEVFGKIAEDAPYTKPEANDFEGKALSFTHDKLKFKTIHEYSSSSGRLVSGLISSTPVALPIGFDHDYDGYKVVAGIIGMKFTPTQAVLNAATYVELPALGPDVGFGLGAKNICFHKDGYSGNGKIVMYLAQDIGYREEGTWSFLFKAPTPTDSGTYMIFDCKQFKEFVIAADVEFPRSWLKPVPDNDPEKLVKASFKTRAAKSGNGWQWLASANLDECEITGANGFKMQVQEMVFDYSSIQNPTGMTFPANYSGTTTNEWKGFYIKRAAITLPDKLKTFENTSPIISVNNMIIDRTGFTAGFRAENVIQYPKGNFGDWGASIDTIGVNLVSSSFQSGSIKGRIKVSVIDSSLIYSGIISRPAGGGNLKYLFSIYPKDTVKADIWKAKLYLNPTSRIELGDTSGKFVAQALFNGKFTLDGDVGGISKLGFKGVTFEGFKVMTISPYIEKGNWSFASPQHSMAGFPVSINNLNIVTGDRGGTMGAGIQFNLNIGLQSGSNAISGTTTLSVWGKMSSGSGPQRFVFDGIDLDSIGINADLGTVKIAGGIRLYNSHAVFGDGFKGAISATFIDQIAVSATAQFGAVNNYRYWYVDAKAIFSTGIPIFSGVGIYGFGGGAWYHMRKSGTTDLASTPSAPDNSATAGITNSGYSYVPDKNVEFGFMAMVVIGTHPSPEAFNGDVGLEAQFLSGGGIGTITVTGEGYMLCSVANRSSAKIRATVNMEYNFPLKTFHGVFNVTINASPLTGGGQMVMHFSPDLWYIKIGEPSNRVNISLSSWLTVDGYFMVGQNLPAPPPLPAEIQSLFPAWSSSPRNSAIEIGDGFAFGASAGFNTGRQTFLIFYGEISAIIGFDFALLNYGTGTNCEGMTGSMGVNGWYAMGQIYAYLAAAIGIHVDLWFVEGDFEILSLRVGAALQGAGPNPTWVKGIVGGQYRILGGAIKGNCSFQFKKGTECMPVVESPLSRIDLIADIDPVNGKTNVDVLSEPQVALNFELETPFELQEMPTGSESSRIRIFRIKLDDFKLQTVSENNLVSGTKVVAPDKFSVYYSPHEMLTGYTFYRFTASAFGEEHISGAWKPAVKNDGTLIKQTVQSVFKTGPAPNVIPPNNVAYTYPVSSHNYFLQNECRVGMIQLISGQNDLFTARPQFDLDLTARFIPIDFNLQPVEVPYTYNPASRRVYFDIPPLLNNKSYYLQIIKKETYQGSDPLFNIQDISDFMEGGGYQTHTMVERLMFSSSTSNLYINQRRISATRVKSGERLLYVYSFKTSNFNTLQAKLSTFNYVSTESSILPNNFELHTAKYEGAEHFGHSDFRPIVWVRSGTTHKFGPLVKIIGHERTSAWHNTFTNPKIYGDIQWLRNKGWWSGTVKYEQYLSNPSLDFVEVSFNSYTLTANDIVNLLSGSSTSTGSNVSGSSGGTFIPGGIAGTSFSGLQTSVFGTQSAPAPNITIKYCHGIIVPADFLTLRVRAINVLSNFYIVKSNSDKTRLNTIIARPYQLMLRGNYPLKYYYNYNGCLGVDDAAPTISKPFIY
ncbi:MAG: hypothetical protein R6W78_16790 [Bacteroidales bacterium]